MSAESRPVPTPDPPNSTEVCCLLQKREMTYKGSVPVVAVLVFTFYCWYAAFSDGWYHFRYTANPTVDPCSLPLWDCGLSACKPKDVRTGFQYTADCTGFSAAMTFFILAGIYGVVFLLYTAGVAKSGKLAHWLKLDCRPTSHGACCVDTTVDCGAKCGFCRGEGKVKKVLNQGKMPHGGVLLGMPCLMFFGLIGVLSQNKDEFEGFPEEQKGYGPRFWWTVAVLLLCLAVCIIECCVLSRVQGVDKSARSNPVIPARPGPPIPGRPVKAVPRRPVSPSRNTAP